MNFPDHTLRRFCKSSCLANWLLSLLQESFMNTQNQYSDFLLPNQISRWRSAAQIELLTVQAEVKLPAFLRSSWRNTTTKPTCFGLFAQYLWQRLCRNAELCQLVDFWSSRAHFHPLCYLKPCCVPVLFGSQRWTLTPRRRGTANNLSRASGLNCA